MPIKVKIVLIERISVIDTMNDNASHTLLPVHTNQVELLPTIFVVTLVQREHSSIIWLVIIEVIVHMVTFGDSQHTYAHLVFTTMVTIVSLVSLLRSKDPLVSDVLQMHRIVVIMVPEAVIRILVG